MGTLYEYINTFLKQTNKKLYIYIYNTTRYYNGYISAR